MTPADRKEFAVAMTTMFAVYNDHLTETILDAWWAIFAEHDLETVTRAMNAHVTDPKAGMFKPTPAHIIDGMHKATAAIRQHYAAMRARLQDELRAIDDLRYKAKNDLDHNLITRAQASIRIAQLDADYRRISNKPEYAELRQMRRAMAHTGE